MSSDVGYGRGFVRLIRIPMILAFVASIAPMAFGLSFAWHLGFITLLLGTVAALAFRSLRPGKPQVDHATRIQRVIGYVEIRSGSMLIGDGPSLRSNVKLDHLPSGRWEVRCAIDQSGDSEQLVEVAFARDAVDTRLSDQRGEVVVDSGQIFAVDAAVEPGSLGLGARASEATSDHTTEGSPRIGVRLLRDSAGTPRGIVVEPPYGDGAYEVRVQQSAAGVQVRLSL